MFELVCGNASHAVGRVRVCFSLWCCDLTDIPLADWSDTAAEWEYYGFWFAVLFALLVFQGHPLTGIILPLWRPLQHNLSLFLYSSLWKSFLMFTWSIPLSSHVCLQSVFLCLTVLILLMLCLHPLLAFFLFSHASFL